jgi:hypothetical protein
MCRFSRDKGQACTSHNPEPIPLIVESWRHGGVGGVRDAENLSAPDQKYISTAGRKSRSSRKGRNTASYIRTDT